ncbi:PqiC family protein [Thalassococcus sp. BH17M4-6]|uniref:PqiC family protein n=1 Tax=Thalassococcus sp. BH17M4-6 TaxID=3413148 RepID=UPI003BF557C9
MTIPLLALTAALTTACSSPDVRFASPAVAPSAKVSSLYGKLEVVEVTLPTYAASENIFVQGADGAITELGPLWADDPARAMTLQLARDFAAITGAIAAPDPWPFRSFPDAKVDVRLEEMLATEDGTFRISGQFFVAPEEGGRDRSGQFGISVPLPEDASISQIAAARSAATTQLAEQIARRGLR